MRHPSGSYAVLAGLAAWLAIVAGAVLTALHLFRKRPKP